MRGLSLLDDPRRRLGFCALFGLYALVLASLLELWPTSLSWPYLKMISSASGAMLNAVGVHTVVGAVPGVHGILSMKHAVFQVTHDCSGMHALALFVAAVLAYPAAATQRLQALAWGLPAFFCYSALRLVALGLIAHWVPSWTQFLHVYLLVIVNAGFLVCLWATWVNRLSSLKAASSA